MIDLWPFFTTLLIIAAAEIGDKTFLLTFGLGARFPLPKVIALIFLATGILMGAVVLLGGFINSLLPPFYIQLAAGILFLVFAFWILFEKEEEGEGQLLKNSLRLVFATFMVAELGDKTQLAKLTLSAKYGASFLVWLGATLGMAGIDSLGAIAGGWMKDHIPEKFVKWFAFAAFVGFGLATLGDLFIW